MIEETLRNKIAEQVSELIKPREQSGWRRLRQKPAIRL